MSLSVWVAFVAAVFVLVVSPGPSVLLGVSHALRFGWRRVLWTALGDVTANVMQMALALGGLGLVLASSASLFLAIKITGVAYLLYLGIRTFRSSPLMPNAAREPARTWGWHWRQGFWVAGSSPKAIAFFAAFFPQFIDPALPLVPQFLVLASTFVVMDYTAVVLYAVLAERGGERLRRSGAARTVNRLAGGAMIAAAGMLALVGRAQARTA